MSGYSINERRLRAELEEPTLCGECGVEIDDDRILCEECEDLELADEAVGNVWVDEPDFEPDFEEDDYDFDDRDWD